MGPPALVSLYLQAVFSAIVCRGPGRHGGAVGVPVFASDGVLSRVNHIFRFSVDQFYRFTSSAWPRC